MSGRGLIRIYWAVAVGCLGCGEGADGARTPGVRSPAGSTGQGLAQCVAEGRGLAEVWSVGNGHGEIQSMALARDGSVALSGTDGSIKIWNLITGTSEQITEEASIGASGGLYGSEFGSGAERNATALTFDSHGGIVAGDEGGGVRRLELDGVSLGAAPAIADFEAKDSPITALAASHDVTKVVFANTEYMGDLTLWDLAAGTSTLLGQTNLWFITSASFSDDDSRLVVVGEWYGIPSVEIWSVEDLTRPIAWWRSPFEWSFTRITQAVLSADGTRLFAGGYDEWTENRGFVAVFDLEAMLVDIEDHEGIVVALTELEDARITDVDLAVGESLFAAAGDDQRVRFFDSVTGEERLQVEASAFIELTADGQRMVTSGADGMLRLWGCK